MADLEKMSLVELRVAGRKMGVKNVTTYKKRELLELLLSIQERQAEETEENAEEKDEYVVVENTAKEEVLEESVQKNDEENDEEIQAEEKRPQNQGSYVKNNDYYSEDHRNTYRARREGGYQSGYQYQGRTNNVRGQQRNNGRINSRQGNNPYSNQNMIFVKRQQFISVKFKSWWISEQL